jgi:hypothetical protein
MSVGYVDRFGHRVFLVHLFLVPGIGGKPPSIGASGSPDPKWLFEDGTVFVVRRSQRSSQR